MLPRNVFSALWQDPLNFAAGMRLTAVVEWYEMGRLSQAKGAEVAGLSRSEFDGTGALWRLALPASTVPRRS